MTPDKNDLGEKLRLVERAREDAYFRQLDQELIDRMRQPGRLRSSEQTFAASRRLTLECGDHIVGIV